MDLELSLNYKMDYISRGKALIFNQVSFSIPDMAIRKGSDIDKDDFYQLLMKWGFLPKDIVIFQNATYRQIMNYLYIMAKRVDHSQNDAFVCAIFTHGNRNSLFASDQQFSTSKLWKYFTDDECPTLKNKPKLFFIQACRGDKLDRGGYVTPTISNTWKSVVDDVINKFQFLNFFGIGNSPAMDSSGDLKDAEPYFDDDIYQRPHNHPDILVSYSTADGYFSFRNCDSGSWFINSLYDVALSQKNLGDIDLISLLTDVNLQIGLGKESFCSIEELCGMKQSACFHSSLTKLVYFTEKN